MYVPESLDVADFFAQAKESNISQIVHGPSDIIKDFVEDYSNPFIINIPQYRGFWMQKHVFEQNEDIQVVFIDEWITQENYESVSVLVFKVDLDDPARMNLFKEFKLGHDGTCNFYEKIRIEECGEYYLRVVAHYPDGAMANMDEVEIIVYRANDGGDEGFDF